MEIDSFAPPAEASGQALYAAWEAAQRFLAARSPWLAGRGERIRCLKAVLDASAVIAGEPSAAGLFAGREEIFLLLVAQGVAESNGNPRAVSARGDLGWAQINRSMLQTLKVEDPFDVAQNAAGQARHLRALLVNLRRRWGREKDSQEILGLALAAYNASSRAVRDGRIPSRGPVAAYVRRVMENYELLKRDAWRTSARLPGWKRRDA